MPTAHTESPLRWKLRTAATEFNWTTESLGRKLNQAGQVPGADKCYSTQQIVSALFGNIAAERLRKTREEADNVALKNSILRGESLPRGLLTPALTEIFTVIRQLIQGSSMTTPEKRDLLNTIATWPVAVKNVAAKAAKQVKLERAEGDNGENGQGEAEED